MAGQRIDLGGGLMKISRGRYINIYVLSEGLHEVGKWQVSAGKKIRERRVRMNLTVERTRTGTRTMGWDQVGLLAALGLLLLNHVCPMLVINEVDDG
jgi:hypothetical protein